MPMYVIGEDRSGSQKQWLVHEFHCPLKPADAIDLPGSVDCVEALKRGKQRKYSVEAKVFACTKAAASQASI